MSLCFENIFTRFINYSVHSERSFFLPDGESHGARRGGFETRPFVAAPEKCLAGRSADAVPIALRGSELVIKELPVAGVGCRQQPSWSFNPIY